MIRCPICNSSNANMTEDLGEYKMFACKNCEVEFADPMKTKKLFYQTNPDYIIRDELIIDNIKWDYRSDIVNFLNNPPSKGGYLLDIGCGTGAFIKRAIQMGFTAYGIDFDEKAIEEGKTFFKIDTLFTTDVKNFKNKFSEIKFDVITLFQVLEHLEDPLLLMREAKELLKDKGIMVIALPYKYRWPILGEKWGDEPPHHLTRWSLTAMKNFLEFAGLEIKKYHIEKFSFHNMAGLLFPFFLKVLPQTTMQGKQLHKKAAMLTAEEKEKLLKRRKLKMSLVNYLSLPLWVILRLVGAKGPNLYVEATKCG